MTDTIMFIIFGIPMAIATWAIAIGGTVLLYRITEKLKEHTAELTLKTIETVAELLNILIPIFMGIGIAILIFKTLLFLMSLF